MPRAAASWPTVHLPALSTPLPPPAAGKHARDDDGARWWRGEWSTTPQHDVDVHKADADVDEADHVEWHETSNFPFTNIDLHNKEKDESENRDEVHWHDALFEFKIENISEYRLDVTGCEGALLPRQRAGNQCINFTLDDQTTMQDTTTASIADWGMDLGRDVDLAPITNVCTNIREREQHNTSVAAVDNNQQRRDDGYYNQWDMLVALWI